MIFTFRLYLLMSGFGTCYVVVWMRWDVFHDVERAVKVLEDLQGMVNPVSNFLSFLCYHVFVQDFFSLARLQ